MNHEHTVDHTSHDGLQEFCECGARRWVLIVDDEHIVRRYGEEVGDWSARDEEVQALPPENPPTEEELQRRSRHQAHQGPLVTWQDAFWALTWQRHNHSPASAVKMAYGEDIYSRSPEYAAEKAKRWVRCPLTFWAGLDPANRDRFVKKLQARYYADATERVQGGEVQA